MDYQNKKIAIVGLGEENLALTRYLVQKGAKPVICDRKGERELGDYYQKVKNLGLELRLGPDYLNNLTDFELIFRAPGVPYLTPEIQAAKKAGVEISSEIKLFFKLCPSPIIGVTGTKGKGTTATLIYEILKKSRRKIYLGGNIGTAPIEFLDKLLPNDIVVLELSSFQLQDLRQSPHIAVVLNIAVDHLDYHQTRGEYVEAKKNILLFQKKNDRAIINADYLTSIEFAALTAGDVYWFSRRKSVDQGAWVKNGQEFILRMDDEDIVVAKTSEVKLRGEHNFENICAAITATHLAGADIDSIKNVVKSFEGLPHRLEKVREHRGIIYYNDSFSTTPETAMAAINSFSEPVILLCGGSEKGADYRELGKEISKSSVKAVISIGLTGEKIIKNITNPKIEKIAKIQSMPEAIAAARQLSNAGDIVLLSPASASFDRYKNYKQRGEDFRKAVLER